MATTASDRNQQAHLLFAADQIERFQKDPHKVDLTPATAPPRMDRLSAVFEVFENRLVGGLP